MLENTAKIAVDGDLIRYDWKEDQLVAYVHPNRKFRVEQYGATVHSGFHPFSYKDMLTQAIESPAAVRRKVAEHLVSVREDGFPIVRETGIFATGDWSWEDLAEAVDAIFIARADFATMPAYVRVTAKTGFGSSPPAMQVPGNVMHAMRDLCHKAFSHCMPHGCHLVQQNTDIEMHEAWVLEPYTIQVGRGQLDPTPREVARSVRIVKGLMAECNIGPDRYPLRSMITL